MQNKRSSYKITINIMMFATAFFLSVFCTCFLRYNTVYASEIETESETVDNDEGYPYEGMQTQTFYHPRSYFKTDKDYQTYLNQMYSYGYMDDNYDWTDSAQNYINNPTYDNSVSAAENAKAVVEKRVEDGEIDYVDNPYLTYDEQQAWLKNHKGEETQQSTGDGDGAYTPSTDEGLHFEHESEDISEMQTETEIQEQTESLMPKMIGYVVIALFIAVLAIIAYSIYRRQF